MAMQRLALASLIALSACFDEPTYEGLFCDESSPCPSGYRCENGQCTSRPPIASDSGEAPEDSGTTFADAASNDDAAAIDVGTDAGDFDAGPSDAGDPNLERCNDAVTYPSAGWEARHFTLGAGFTFDECFGVEDVPTDIIDRDYRGTGPFNGTIVDFGSRYTATRTFEEGVYTFTVTHDDGIRIRIDGQIVYELWAHGFVSNVSAYSQYLTAGPHQLEIEHFDDEGWAQISVSWQRGCLNLSPARGSWVLSYHGWDPMIGVIMEQCYGFDVVSATSLSLNGTPASVAAQSVSSYAIVGRGIHDFLGMTRIDLAYTDGLRASLDGQLVLDDWVAGPLSINTINAYLPGTSVISFEKFATTSSDQLSIDWISSCDDIPMLGVAEWWARYYRVLYVANPESWTLDLSDCLGTQIIPSDRLMQSGDPPPIAALGVVSLWGAEFFGTRSFGAATTVDVTYDDGIRVYDNGVSIFESWFGPQVASTSLTLGAGSHDLRLQYFQNFGGTQVQFTW